MTSRVYTNLLRRYFGPNAYMKWRYPKAYKKARVRKKWLNRFGKDVDWAEEMAKPSFIYGVVEDSRSDFKGGTIEIPFFPAGNAEVEE